MADEKGKGSEKEAGTDAQWEVVAPTALESIERAQVDLQIATARRFPRSMSVVLKDMQELALLDEEIAASCFYRLNRQGKDIEGPTIRLAEIAVSCFGHIRFGARVIENDGKSVTAQGFCFDLQKNIMASMEVKRRITNKEGRTFSDDMQLVTGNAACAIAARNAVFKVIPMAIIKPILTAAKKAAVGDIKTLAERRTRMLEKLAALGISAERVCQAVNRKGVEDIGLDELGKLFGLYNAIREEQQTVEEAFPELKKTASFGPGLAPADDGKGGDGKGGDGKGGDGKGEGAPPAGEKRGRGRPRKPAEAPAGDGGDGGGNAGDPPPPSRATPLEGLRNIMRTNQPPIEDKDLLTYLFSINKVEQGETLEKMGDDKIKMIIDQWPLIAPNVGK